MQFLMRGRRIKPMANRNRIIKASELAQYGYCARAWWLGSVKGIAPANTEDLRRGTASHARHGRSVWAAGALRAGAIALVVLGLMALAFAIFVK